MDEGVRRVHGKVAEQAEGAGARHRPEDADAEAAAEQVRRDGAKDEHEQQREIPGPRRGVEVDREEQWIEGGGLHVGGERLPDPLVGIPQRPPALGDLPVRHLRPRCRLPGAGALVGTDEVRTPEGRDARRREIAVHARDLRRGVEGPATERHAGVGDEDHGDRSEDPERVPLAAFQRSSQGLFQLPGPPDRSAGSAQLEETASLLPSLLYAATNAFLTLSGPLSGAGGFTAWGGGVIELSGAQNNTFAGTAMPRS